MRARVAGHIARAITSSCNGIIVSVAEPDSYKRTHFGSTFIWGTEEAPRVPVSTTGVVLQHMTKQRRQRATNAEEVVPPGVDAAFVCVLDEDASRSRCRPFRAWRPAHNVREAAGHKPEGLRGNVRRRYVRIRTPGTNKTSSLSAMSCVIARTT